MTTHAYYDIDSTIRALVVFNGPKGTGMMLAPRPGVLVAEVEGLPLKKGKLDLELLQKIVEREKINLPIPKWTYKSKDGR